MMEERRAKEATAAQDICARVERAVEGWNAAGFEGMRYFIHPDAVVTPFEEWPDDDVYYGVDGFGKLAAQWTEQFEDIFWRIDRLLRLDDDTVLALVDHNGRMRDAGVPMSAPLGVLVGDFRPDGTVARVRFFLGWEKALEAVPRPGGSNDTPEEAARAAS